MQLSSSSSAPSVDRSDDVTRMLPAALLLGSVFGVGVAIGATRSIAAGAAVAGLAVALGIALFAARGLPFRPAPKRLVPLGLSPVFAVRLTGGSLLVGRSPTCDVVLPLATVSASHCLLRQTRGGWLVEDLQSRNGTLVNNRPVRRKRLRPGDKLSIGELEFVVR